MAELHKSEEGHGFAHFPMLPQEIRQMIWNETVLPRLITLRCREYNSNPAEDDSTTYRMYTSPGSAAGPTQPVVFSPGREIRFNISKIDPIVSLIVCKESRSIAFRQGGYRVWKIANTNDKTRDMMWSPLLDTIAFEEPHDPSLPFLYRSVFRKQYPTQTKEVRTLALPTSHWSRGQAKSTLGGIVSMWLDFGSLREIVVVVDEQYEIRSVAALGIHQHGSEEGESWVIPRDIERGLESLRSSLPEAHWNPPKVRVVRNQESIMGDQSEKWRLRSRADPDEQELLQLN